MKTKIRVTFNDMRKFSSWFVKNFILIMFIFVVILDIFCFIQNVGKNNAAAMAWFVATLWAINVILQRLELNQIKRTLRNDYTYTKGLTVDDSLEHFNIKDIERFLREKKLKKLE